MGGDVGDEALVKASELLCLCLVIIPTASGERLGEPGDEERG